MTPPPETRNVIAELEGASGTLESSPSNYVYCWFYFLHLKKRIKFEIMF